jgi:SpoVK/Ycf46/Vps4 family AAA+-type ATPase
LPLITVNADILYDDIVYALASAAPQELQGIDTTLQSASCSGWDAIGGYVDVKKRLIQLIQWPWEHPLQFEVQHDIIIIERYTVHKSLSLNIAAFASVKSLLYPVIGE